MQEINYMERALTLAKKGQGKTSPNPLVGAVIVKEGKIIGEGYHKYAGGKHAEINALEAAGKEAKGAALYVNLEPCAHYGKTPPCTERVIEAGIKKVIIAMKDPNPQVKGKGIQQLKEAGIEVEVGVKEEEARRLNETFIKYIATGCPFVVLKNALTLDGKIATRTGDARWISGEKSRKIVHQLRNKFDGILVGIGTVLTDNPRLTTRLPEGGQDPIRVIVDSKLRIPLTAQVINQESSASTIVATTNQADKEKKKQLKKLGVEVIKVGEEQIDLSLLLGELASREITSLLVEGGSKINTSFWEEKLVDKLYYFIAPKIIGGVEAVPAVGGKGVKKVKEGIKIINKEVKEVGEDILVVGYPEYKN